MKSSGNQYKIARAIFFAELARRQDRLAPLCEVCEEKPAVEVHHKEGRSGDKLIDRSDFLGVCNGCHNDITHNRNNPYGRGFSNRRNNV